MNGFSNNVKILFNFRNKFEPKWWVWRKQLETTEMQFAHYWISRKMDRHKNVHVFEEFMWELDYFLGKNSNKQFDWKQPVQIHSFFSGIIFIINLISFPGRNFFPHFFSSAVVGFILHQWQKIIIITNIWTLKREKPHDDIDQISSWILHSVYVRCVCAVDKQQQNYLGKKCYEMQFIILCKTILLYMLTATNSQAKREVHWNVIS